MTFEEFVNEIKTGIREHLPEEYADASLDFTETKKLNETYPALIVRTGEDCISPSINLRTLYEDYLENEDIESTMGFLSEIVQKRPDGLSIERISDYEQARENLFIRVCDADKNRDFLENVPHTKVENLAITYHILVEVGEGEMGSTTVTENLLETYGVTKEQLHADAVENSIKVLEPKLTPMLSVIGEMMGIGEVPHEENETFDEMLARIDSASSDMIVLSNRQGVNGAAVIFYPEVMDKVGEQLEGDYFIIPSSIHEVLLVPDKGRFEYRELEETVHEINANEVKPCDVLSDRVYHYDNSEKKFELAESFAERTGKEKETKHKKEKDYER